MNVIQTWLVAHQALAAMLILFWPTLTGLASLGVQLLDATSRGHAVLSFLAAIGVDIPKIIDAIGRMITPPSSKPPSPPAGLAVFAFVVIGGVAGISSIVAVSSCTPQGGVQAPIANTASCLIDTISKDLLAGMSLPSALEDATIRCLGSATPANVTAASQVWSSHKAAEQREVDGGK
jgi:hypothetical protein